MCPLYAIMTAVLMVSLVFWILLYIATVAAFKHFYIKDESDENQ